MKSKEEILKYWLDQSFEVTMHFDTIGKIHEAMQQYAEQEAVAFAEWKSQRVFNKPHMIKDLYTQFRKERQNG